MALDMEGWEQLIGQETKLPSKNPDRLFPQVTELTEAVQAQVEPR